MIEKPRIQGPYSTCSIFALVSCLGDRYAIGNKIEAPYPSVAWFLYNMILKNGISYITDANTMTNSMYKSSFQSNYWYKDLVFSKSDL